MLKNLIKGFHSARNRWTKTSRIYQVSTQSDVNCRRSYTETKKFTDGWRDRQTDAEGYNIIRPFFKRAYKKVSLLKWGRIRQPKERAGFYFHMLCLRYSGL